MARVILVHEPGGPNAMMPTDVQIGKPGPGEVRLRQTAIGVNFIDTYHRSGLYPVPGLPFTPGMEAVGEIEMVGEGVKGFEEGDRVCYGNGPIGAYASERIMPVNTLVKVPGALKDEQVAGMMLRGLTVWYLLRSLYQLKEGETVLFHAAAGGVGLIFCQWARAIGATVIGTVGSEEKAELAKANGCTHTIQYRQEDFVGKVKEITDGKGVSVVYDGVGKDTFMGSLDCLRKRGLMVSFGNASGPPPAIEVGMLGPKGSLFVTRPTLFDYTGTRPELELATKDLFEMVGSGAVEIDVGQSYALEQVAHAHNDLVTRQTSGSTVLLV
jgi:NADPH2:quinone reductase